MQDMAYMTATEPRQLDEAELAVVSGGAFATSLWGAQVALADSHLAVHIGHVSLVKSVTPGQVASLQAAYNKIKLENFSNTRDDVNFFKTVRAIFML
jgi:hypothetical protein